MTCDVQISQALQTQLEAAKEQSAAAAAQAESAQQQLSSTSTGKQEAEARAAGLQQRLLAVAAAKSELQGHLEVAQRESAQQAAKLELQVSHMPTTKLHLHSGMSATVHGKSALMTSSRDRIVLKPSNAHY